jgi:cell division protein FtsN
MELNPEITNPDLILINQQIKLPEITESLLIKKSSDGTVHVHLGTFPSSREAARYREDNNLKGKKVDVIQRKVSRTVTWYRVLVGPFASRDEALKFIETIKQKGLLPSLQHSSKKEQ